jgi:hypothetical protein
MDSATGRIRKEREEKHTNIPLTNSKFEGTTHTQYLRCGGAAWAPNCTCDGMRIHICTEQVWLGCSEVNSSVSSTRDAAARRKSEATVRTNEMVRCRCEGLSDVDAERERCVEIDRGEEQALWRGRMANTWKHDVRAPRPLQQ